MANGLARIAEPVDVNLSKYGRLKQRLPQHSRALDSNKHLGNHTKPTGDRLVPFEQASHMFASRYHQKPKDLH